MQKLLHLKYHRNANFALVPIKNLRNFRKFKTSTLICYILSNLFCGGFAGEIWEKLMARIPMCKTGKLEFPVLKLDQPWSSMDQQKNNNLTKGGGVRRSKKRLEL